MITQRSLFLRTIIPLVPFLQTFETDSPIPIEPAAVLYLIEKIETEGEADYQAELDSYIFRLKSALNKTVSQNLVSLG